MIFKKGELVRGWKRNNTKNLLEYIRKSQTRQCAEDSLREQHEQARPAFFCFNWKWLQSEVEGMGGGEMERKE